MVLMPHIYLFSQWGDKKKKSQIYFLLLFIWITLKLNVFKLQVVNTVYTDKSSQEIFNLCLCSLGGMDVKDNTLWLVPML